MRRVDGRWPEVASVLLLGLEGYLQDLRGRLVSLEDAEPEPAPSRGKPGSRPEDLAPVEKDPW